MRVHRQPSKSGFKAKRRGLNLMARKVGKINRMIDGGKMAKQYSVSPKKNWWTTAFGNPFRGKK